MNKETLEHISCLMDGELSREAGLFLTRRLSADKELTGTWERYHLIRDCIRQPGTRVPMVDLSTRMKVALSEEAETQVNDRQARPWLKPVAGFAVAASVALIAIVAVGPGQVQNVDDVAGTQVESFTSPNVLPGSVSSQPASFSGSATQSNPRLNSYLVRHNQLVGSVSNQGFLSFVPIVSSAATEQDTAESDASTDPVNEPEKTDGAQ
jgi:sigma-E factor negative regulatory protein RseA